MLQNHSLCLTWARSLGWTSIWISDALVLVTMKAQAARLKILYVSHHYTSPRADDDIEIEASGSSFRNGRSMRPLVLHDSSLMMPPCWWPPLVRPYAGQRCLQVLFALCISQISFSLLLIKGVLLKATAKKIGREINRSWRIDRQVVGRVEPLTKGVFRWWCAQLTVASGATNQDIPPRFCQRG